MRVYEKIKRLDIAGMVNFILCLKKNSINCVDNFGCLKCLWSKPCRIYSIDYLKRWLCGWASISEGEKLEMNAELTKPMRELDRIRALSPSELLGFIAAMKKIHYKCGAVNSCKSCSWFGLCNAYTDEQIENWLRKSVMAAAAEMKEMREK